LLFFSVKKAQSVTQGDKLHNSAVTVHSDHLKSRLKPTLTDVCLHFQKESGRTINTITLALFDLTHCSSITRCIAASSAAQQLTSVQSIKCSKQMFECELLAHTLPRVF